jgi:hypothetical protein
MEVQLLRLSLDPSCLQKVTSTSEVGIIRLRRPLKLECQQATSIYEAAIIQQPTSLHYRFDHYTEREETQEMDYEDHRGPVFSGTLGQKALQTALEEESRVANTKHR